MTGWRHLRLVAYGDDVDEPARRRLDAAGDARLYAATVAEFERRGWHPLVAAIEAARDVDRRRAERERQRR